MRGATGLPSPIVFRLYLISIHAPHAGRDSSAVEAVKGGLQFQSTRPMRGATHRLLRQRGRTHISIHAPHAGRDFVPPPLLETFDPISIHAPHAGRDADDDAHGLIFEISIHAPHAGRDGCRGNCICP